ncbi:MAG: cyclase family protein [Bacteroidetes bacterium]|nr:MAG: cyclase family protein [Bacteroidota bacterium]
MLAKIEYKGQYFSVHLNQPIDISIPMQNGLQNPNAFGISAPVFEPFKAGGFIGSVALGGSVNCENIQFNPHGNGTHTECVGHISKERITIHETLQEFMFMAQLVTVELNQVGDDHKVLLSSIKDVINNNTDALIIRTLPNDTTKLTQTYSGKNPAYLQEELCAFLSAQGIKHLIIDLPSVDREEDGGALAAHHAFWNYPASPRFDATITEMAYIPNNILDGLYLLNLQIASLQTDASPSKPILYKISHVL